MKNLASALIALLALFVVVGQSQQQQQQQKGKSLVWAYPNPDPAPTAGKDAGPKKLAGSSQSYTQAQIDDLFNPPDWFPNQHGPLPRLVRSGIQAQACGACHLMSGMGHPESADLAGLPYEYMVRQMDDFKAGLRKDAPGYETSQRAQRMQIIAAGLPEEEMREALKFFSAMKPEAGWYKVVEAQTVAKSWVNGGRMRLPLPAGGTEPLGNRIITLPQDPERVESRDPHSGFIAYVPTGSIDKGKALVTTGNNGKTLQCAICHGEGLKGLGDIPRLAGVHPIYIVRQLYNFQVGANTSSAAAPMKKVVEKLTEDDMISIAAYTASLAP
jgi:cytochrome c553